MRATFGTCITGGTTFWDGRVSDSASQSDKTVFHNVKALRMRGRPIAANGKEWVASSLTNFDWK